MVFFLKNDNFTKNIDPAKNYYLCKELDEIGEMGDFKGKEFLEIRPQYPARRTDVLRTRSISSYKGEDKSLKVGKRGGSVEKSGRKELRVKESAKAVVVKKMLTRLSNSIYSYSLF